MGRLIVELQTLVGLVETVLKELHFQKTSELLYSTSRVLQVNIKRSNLTVKTNGREVRIPVINNISSSGSGGNNFQLIA